MSLGRILVVDDEPQVVAMIRDVLASLEYDSQGALDGSEALRLVPSYRPDVVLLDLYLALPGMVGTEVLAVLRRNYPEVPVVMVTANQDEGIARETLTLGAFDYVRKPFDLGVLERVLSAALVYRAVQPPVALGAQPPAAAASPTPANVTQGIVLYIEDNPANVQLVEMLLRQRPGVECITAMTAGDGLRLAGERRPDLILLDIHLPDMEGDEVLQRFRQDPDLRRIPVIILSAEGDATLPDRMRAAGAQGYLDKPLDFQQFFVVVDAHLPRSAR
jgi:DNA-binding response OmpR family regulator